MTVITKDRADPEFPLMEQGSRLYLLGRSDLYQMNPGKLAAQAAHAATQFVFDTFALEGDHGLRVTELMNDWRAQGGGGFGTKITLYATKDEIEQTVEYMNENFGLQTGLVVDPSYPFTNYYGDFFTAEELTFGYVFVTSHTSATALEYLKQFPLYP